MNPKWIIGLAIAFIAGTIICNIIDMVSPLGDAGVEGTATYHIDQMINKFQAIGTASVIGKATLFFGGLWEFLIALGNMFIWNYSFLQEGNLQILRWLLFIPISAGLCWPILQWLISTVAGVIGRIF